MVIPIRPGLNANLHPATTRMEEAMPYTLEQLGADIRKALKAGPDGSHFYDVGVVHSPRRDGLAKLVRIDGANPDPHPGLEHQGRLRKEHPL
jgi:hypothetical protein